jgi:uncharacterized protein DUF6600
MARIMSRLARAALLTGIAAGALAMSVPAGSILISPAAAQAAVKVSADFRIALEPFGAWRHHARFGEVWVPAHRGHNWRPYTVGHWVYTETYGWYWVEAVEEADWGWITYHYGRWYLDPADGWVWIAADEWSPGWTEWRYGADADVVGWAPLPPDEVVVEVEQRPDYWAFVRFRDFAAPRFDRVILAPQQARVFFGRTAIVNRTVAVRDGRFAVNPGIPATLMAARYGRPLTAYQVRPRVLAGTAALPGATQIRAEEWRRHALARQSERRGDRFATLAPVIAPSRAMIRPERSAPAPQPLARGEPGRLGPAPPLAAREGFAERNRQQLPGRNAQKPGETAPPATAQERRTPGAPAGQQPNERRQGAATPQNGQPKAPTAGAETPHQPPNQPRTTGQAAGKLPGGVDQQQGRRNATQAQHPAAETRTRPSAPPAAVQHAAPAPHPAPVQHAAPASRPAPVQHAAPAPRPAPVQHAAPAPRPAPPPVAARPAPPPPAAAARPAAPATTGAAPRGGPERKKE